ncbi:polysaccharide deacetylase family protein [Sphingomonas lenta]|uniref:WalW protein n=1 Tax=Sphingomonas lenta TaxID=1141887 RepID=A0A2A2SGW6_9SPHN|nr:polysaccharide deacetylase family protein [Sphingomonas lenta]PAX08458.1 WalW protein [Sphingomonas lenta]
MADRAQPYREPPPAADALVRWPDRWGTRFLLTVDVEEEFDWGAPLDRAQRSTTAMRAFPDAHRRFADQGAPLTCLVDHPIATDPASVEVLREVLADGRSAIGAQLHAWVNPPFEEERRAGDSFPGALPETLEAAKLDRLTDAIAGAFGTPPRIYRAGRYGIGPNTRRLLRERGYLADSSVRAHYSYVGEGGPDFGAVGNHAYRVDGLLELPLTTVFTGRARAAGARLFGPLGMLPRGRGVAARSGLLSRVALTPEGMPLADALRAVDIAVGDGVRLLVFSFHSPSLAPGHTPYVRDAEDLRRFWAWWTAMFARLERLGVRAASLDEVLAAADQV